MIDAARSEGFGTRGVLLIVDDALAAAEAARAIEITRLGTPETIGWRAFATAALDTKRLVVMVEAEGVEAELLDGALPRIEAFAEDTGAQIIVALAESQIDPVTAHLFGRTVQLLCAPRVVDRVAALAQALAASSGSSVQGSDGESARLQRLSEEIARIAETLTELSRRDFDADDTRGSVSDRSLAFAAPSAGDVIDPQAIRRAIRARRLRDSFFDPGLFEDPAWDMLLDLFAAELEHAQVSVSSLCIAAAVAPTTALRWITKMTEAGLFERAPDPADRRRAFMLLSAKARAGMQSYLAACQRAGLAIG